MFENIEIKSSTELILYLNDINEYVNSILLYHNGGYNNLDLTEILMYLSSVDEIIKTIINYLDD